MIPDSNFIEKLIANFTVKFGDMFFSKTVAGVSWKVIFL